MTAEKTRPLCIFMLRLHRHIQCHTCSARPAGYSAKQRRRLCLRTTSRGAASSALLASDPLIGLFLTSACFCCGQYLGEISSESWSDAAGKRCVCTVDQPIGLQTRRPTGQPSTYASASTSWREDLCMLGFAAIMLCVVRPSVLYRCQTIWFM